MNSKLRVAVVGLDGPGNGHPFSFSAIINGYNEGPMREAGWGVIADYLAKRSPDEFGIEGVQVTHAWTQDSEITRLLCASGRIPHACRELSELHQRDTIDAVLLARDDGHRHWEFAKPFLDLGIPVLVDKPLCTDLADFKRFEPYAKKGLVLSASGMKYAPELSEIRGSAEDKNALVVRGVISNGWDRYAIHIIDGLLSCTTAEPTSVWAVPLSGDGVTAVIRTNTAQHWIITAGGDGTRVARFDWSGPFPHRSIDISSNFFMFRELLRTFVVQVKTGRAQRDFRELERSIQILVGAKESIEQQRWIDLN